MGKKRRKSKKTSYYPNPINSLVNFAGGVTMGIVAEHMEEKYHYTKKGKINPYSVSAMGIASGRLKTTEDLIWTGAFLGAMGSFDVEADDVPVVHAISDKPDVAYRKRVYAPENPLFKEIRETKTNDNRYAWRLNDKEGADYGVSPYDYETRAQYSAAILRAKENKANIMPLDEQKQSPVEIMQPETVKNQICVKVSRLDDGRNQYFRTSDDTINIGDIVLVETAVGTVKGVVIGIEQTLTADNPRYRIIDVLK